MLLYNNTSYVFIYLDIMVAVIASKKGALSLLTKGVSGSSKLLAAAAVNKVTPCCNVGKCFNLLIMKVPSANMNSKTSGNLEPCLEL